jgi:hypothetical protein
MHGGLSSSNRPFGQQLHVIEGEHTHVVSNAAALRPSLPSLSLPAPASASSVSQS